MEPYYQDELVTIYNADCADVLPSIDPADVALVLTDPPYGMDYLGNHADRATDGKVGGKQASSRSWPRVEGDNMPFDPEPLLSYGRCVLWGANFYASKLPDMGCWLVFNKRGEGGQSSPMQGDAELAWTNMPSQRVHLFSKVWHGAPRWRAEPVLHPTQKPVDLMRWIIEKWTEPGDLVLDPYMGSGPVAQACAEMGRRYVGVELVEDYCAAAVGRLSQQALDLTT